MMVKCEICGIEINRPPSTFQRSRDGKFCCSKKCLYELRERKHLTKPSGIYSKEGAISAAIQSIPPGLIVTVDEIIDMVSKLPGRYHFSKQVMTAYIGIVGGMERVAPCVWRRLKNPSEVKA